MKVEHFDLESKEGRRESSASRGHRQKWSAFSCLTTVVLTLFAGFFILILMNLRIGRQEVVVEIQSLQASAKDSLSEEEEGACEEEDLCLTKECVLTSARILSFMDDTKKPCEDFYEFACGNYPKLKAVRFGEDVYDPHAEATDNIDINIKRFMDNAKPNTASTSLNAMKILYDSCLNMPKRDTNSSDTLIHFLEEYGLSWPILNSEVEQETSWSHFITEMEKYGIHTIFYPSVVTADYDITSVILRCSMPMLPPRIYLNPNDDESSSKMYFYRNVVLLFLDYMGIKRTEGKKVFADIMQLETELASTFRSENIIDDDCNQPCSKSQCPPCKEKSSEESHPLSAEHEQQLKEIYANTFHIPIETIDLRTDCSGNVEEMMRVINSATKKTLMNYLGWRAVSHLMQFMGSKYQGLYNHYAGRMMIADTIPGTKWRECTQFVRNNLGVVIAKALVDTNYIKQEQFDEMKKRFIDVKNSFGHVLHTIPWLNNQTMSWFTAKLDKMTLQIGYPDAANAPGVIDAAFSDLHINQNGTYFENVMKLRAFQIEHAFIEQRGPKILDFMNLGTGSPNSFHLEDQRPLEASASYDYHKNIVVIGLGNLISPFLKFGPGLPKYLEYGQEVILAHQVSHAFDTTGITYDGSGTQINVELLPEVVRHKFYAFVLCLSQQYAAAASSTYDPSDISVINKDIADLGSFFITTAGLYHNIELDHGDDVGRLPGLPYSKRQIYFLQAAQTFCEIRETYSMRNYQLPTRTQKQRVNGAVANSVNFGDVFKCSDETKMNPSAKCNHLN